MPAIHSLRDAVVHARPAPVRRVVRHLADSVTLGSLLAMLIVLAALFGMSAVQAATVTLKLVAARANADPAGPIVAKGDPITAGYKYILNIDNTGTTAQRSPAPGTGCNRADTGYPASCQWTSIAGAAGWSPVYSQGDQSDFAAPGMNLPDGRYLISVLADGYKLDGQHFTVVGNSVIVDGVTLTTPTVTVYLQPTPLPDATIQAAVFEDVSPVNSAPDLPAEHGLAGFQGHITDTLGEVTTDVYGGPLCETGRCLSACYVVSNGKDVGTVQPVDAAGRCPSALPATMSQCTGGVAPHIVTVSQTAPYNTFQCPAAAGGGSPTSVNTPAGAVVEGKVKIPNVGPNRYALSVTPPDGSGWIQTTTLEGNHDWDAWVMEGATGLDTEFVIAGEPFPAIIFGYVPAPGTPSAVGSPVATPLTGGSTITGVVDFVKIYVPTTGGVGGLPGQIWGGLQGAVIDKPIVKPWVTLTSLGNAGIGDTIVWAGQGDANGKFTITGVPAGTYTLTWWDEPQNTILDLVNVTVGANETIDMGILPLSGWWTFIDGYVFDDTNRNGVRDPGELGLPGYTLTLRRRDNSLMDRGTTATTTDVNGYYKFEAAYPMTQWLVLEAYDDLHYGTGVTYQADNQPTPTTVPGAGVDVSVLPIIGLSGRLDWGKHVYDVTGVNDPENGGIVGTVTYDTTRNELDPRYAAVEDWQPSVPDLVMKLYEPVPAGAACVNPATRLNASGSNMATALCESTGRYLLNKTPGPDFGSLQRGPLLNTYVTETWFRPSGCVARGADGQPIAGTGEQVLPTDPNAECLEAPLMGVQFSPDAANVNGNYGFGDGCFAPNVLDATNPDAPVCRTSSTDATPVKFTPLPGGRDYLVQVDLNSLLDAKGRPIYKVTREEDINIGNGDAFYPSVPPSACAGALHTVDVFGLGADGLNATPNPTFVDIGGSPYEGNNKPLCDVKLVRLSKGSSIAPAFNVFTDVPLPGRHWFIIIDDLNFSSDPRSTTFGEKAGMPFVPVGIYDFSDRLVTTVESDYNGLADVLLPSTNRINCPTPSGVCTNLYRYVGNDPGVPGRLNPNYNPSYRTISAEFEVMPGAIIPADLAPTQVGVTVQLPGAQNTTPLMCKLDESTPQLYAVNDPVITATQRSLVINGAGFGTAGTLTLGGTALGTSSWSDNQITATVPTTAALGPQQLMITRTDNGQSLVNGLTIHVLGSTAPAMPTIALLDNFERANANTLGGNWNQLALGGNAGIRVNGNQAFALLGANAYWGTSLGTSQGAAFTFANTTLTNNALWLKASGTFVLGVYPTAIRVRYTGSNVLVQTTTNGGLAFTTVGTFAASFATGDTLSAVVDASGTVYVWKTTGTTTTLLGQAAAPAFTGTGRVGMQLATSARVDNFGGGTVTLAAGSGGYNPALYTVGPGRTYVPQETLPAAADHAIQRALDAAATFVGQSTANANRGALVVVYPNNPSANPRQNPRGAYYENLIVTSKVKLQGVGPGSPTGSVRGSIIDGGAFAGDSPVATDWYTRIALETAPDAAGNAVPTWGGNATIYDGAVISLYLPSSGDRAFPTGPLDLKTAPSIDGFDLRGGNQQGFPGNINAIGGTPTGLPAGLITQGGAIFANAYANNLQITNNVVQNNGGAYGAIRIGTPDLPDPDNHNDGVVIGHNRVITNAGTNLAGGIGLFGGADRYQVSYNDICGNFSSEYGGGVSVVGYSPNGTIDHNRIYFNRSFDEGGGIMIAGALPANTTTLSPGSGPVDIYNNLIQANLANDDGGGVRFLMAGNFPMNVFNNFIVNNISTHEGGGVALNDTPDVRFFNNTVMKNLTTATALTSNGGPAPAGLSTSQNSALLQAALPGGSPSFSNPLLFNNIFWDNRAGTRGGSAVIGLGNLADCSTAPGCDYWDLGIADGTGVLSPSNSVIQQVAAASGPRQYTDTANSHANPNVVAPYDVGVTFNTWRNNPAFLGAIMISADLPPNLMGNYHLLSGSPAVNLGAASKGSTVAPALDIDNQSRATPIDSGADELGAAPPPPPPSATLTFTSATGAALSGATLDFGSIGGLVNQSVITLTVAGGSATFGNVAVQGGNGNRFSEVGGTCQNATIAAGGTCTVIVNFNAIGDTLRTGGLTVPYNGPASPAALTLTGQ